MNRYNVLITILSALCSLIPALLYSQSVDTAWVRTYNGPANGNEGARQIRVDSLGNIYVAGASLGISSWYDYTTIKYNPNGDTLWLRKYNGTANSDDFVQAMALDNQSNVYVTGYSTSPGSSQNYATVKYNSAGIEQWVRRYDGPGPYADQAYAIAVDNQDNVYITGASSGLTSSDCVTIKYNANGDTLWIRSYNGPTNQEDVGNAIAIDNQGNVYVAGYTQGIYMRDYLLIKYNANGDTAWVRTYNNPQQNSDDIEQTLVLDNQGNSYISGFSSGANDADIVTIKYNPSGQEQWLKSYDGPGHTDDVPIKMIMDAQNNFYIIAVSYDSTGFEDYLTLKYNASGDTQWTRRYTTAEDADDEPRDVTLDNQNNVYVTGESDSSQTAMDILTVTYDSLGTLKWISRYTSSGLHEHIGEGIAVDRQGYVYVTGFYYNPPNYSDFVTIKYTQLSGIEEERSTLTAKRNTLEVFPNPAKTYFTVRLPKTADRSEIKIFDVIGNIVKSEELKGKNNRISLDGIKNGVYFVQVGDEMVKEKLVVTR